MHLWYHDQSRHLLDSGDSVHSVALLVYFNVIIFMNSLKIWGCGCDGRTKYGKMKRILWKGNKRERDVKERKFLPSQVYWQTGTNSQKYHLVLNLTECYCMIRNTLSVLTITLVLSCDCYILIMWPTNFDHILHAHFLLTNLLILT